jgi:hypothetical protein
VSARGSEFISHFLGWKFERPCCLPDIHGGSIGSAGFGKDALRQGLPATLRKRKIVVSLTPFVHEDFSTVADVK